MKLTTLSSASPALPDVFTLSPARPVALGLPIAPDFDTAPRGRRRQPSTLPNLSTPAARRENSRSLKTPGVDWMRGRVGELHQVINAHNLDYETGEIAPRVFDATRALKASLDKEAKSASTAPRAGGPGGAKTPGTPEGSDALEARRRMFQLQDTAAHWLKGQRVASCGRLAAAGAVDVRVSPDGQAYMGGLQTCASVWACPVCSAKVTAARRDELHTALQEARSLGLHVSMLTLTAPHGPTDKLRALQEAHRAAYRLFTSGRYRLKALLESVGFVGTIRAQEVTHGENGWHPHWHTLIFTSEPITLALRDRLFASWQRAAAHAGLGQVSTSALSLERSIRLTGDELAGRFGLYVCKWGAAEELTRSHVKKAGRGGRSPWQLLGDATDGDRRAARLFQVYALAYKGQRQLVWSQGLRDLLGLSDPPSDEEIAQAEPDGYAVALVLEGHDWRRVRQSGKRFELLEVATAGAGPLCLSPGRRAREAVLPWLAELRRSAAPGAGAAL